MRVEDTDVGRSFVSLFTGSTAEVDLTGDFVSAEWAKLCINAAAVVSALTMKPADVLRDAMWGQVALDLIGSALRWGGRKVRCWMMA